MARSSGQQAAASPTGRTGPAQISLRFDTPFGNKLAGVKLNVLDRRFNRPLLVQNQRDSNDAVVGTLLAKQVEALSLKASFNLITGGVFS
jgi:hypothetical protein